MKKPLYYTIKTCVGFLSLTPVILAVTSERRWRINGREMPLDKPTHTTQDKVYGRFETLEQAEAVIDKLAKIRKDYAPLIKNAQETLTRLHGEQESLMRKAVK